MARATLRYYSQPGSMGAPACVQAAMSDVEAALCSIDG
jgi:hypothetical protein